VILPGRMREGQDDEKTSERHRGAECHRAAELYVAGGPEGPPYI